MAVRLMLVGMMGAGKTSLGRQVARRLDVPFRDLDHEIERRAGSPIPALFEAEGESGFRLRERDVLHQVLGEGGDMVLACGGGTPCFYDNMARLLQSGTVVWLEATPAFLASRLNQQTGQRPLLRGREPQPETLIPHLAELLAQRRPWYEQAHFRLHLPDREAVETLVRWAEAAAVSPDEDVYSAGFRDLSGQDG